MSVRFGIVRQFQVALQRSFLRHSRTLMQLRHCGPRLQGGGAVRGALPSLSGRFKRSS